MFGEEYLSAADDYDRGSEIMEMYDGERNEEGERHGYGKSLFGNGDIYEGQYQNGKRHGYGKYTFNSNARYEGYYKEGLRNGKGNMVFPDTSVYSGEWKNNKRNGRGIYIYTNGDRYDGEWCDGHKYGQGTYTYSAGKLTYRGTWDYNRFNGKGELHTDCFSFHGTFKNQQPRGVGCFVFNNSCAQVGEFVKTIYMDDDADDEDNYEETVMPTWHCISLRHAFPRNKIATKDVDIWRK